MRDVDRQLSATVFQEVDLATAGWQPIAGGFYVIDISAAAAGQGDAHRGKIINPTSVTHETAQISVRIGAERATFTLPRVPPAVAQPFEVTLANVPPPTETQGLLRARRLDNQLRQLDDPQAQQAESRSTPTSCSSDLVGPARSAGTQLQIGSAVANRACGAGATSQGRLHARGRRLGATAALADDIAMWQLRSE